MSNKLKAIPSESYWLKTGKRDSYPTLNKNIETEIAVVGAGIGGILTAYQLRKQGKAVALFERFEILNGTTGNTTAKLSAQHGLIYQDLIKRYGEEIAKKFYEANMGGINEIKRIADELDLKNVVSDETVYAYTTEAEKIDSFKKEIEAYKKLGIKGDYLEKTPLGFKVKAAVSMADQGILHPVEFLNGVLRHLVKNGLKAYEHTLINEMEPQKDKPIILKSADGQRIKCKQVVFTTHYPQIEKDDHYDQIYARSTLALAYKTDKKLFEGAHIAYDTPSVTLRTMEYFGDHYFLIGGQSHTTGDDFSEEERYEKIHQLAQKLFSVKVPSFKWSSHDLMTKDHIPFIGQLHPDFSNAYTITGLNAWGLANSSAGAMLIADLINGKENPYKKMYDPFRSIPPLEKDDKAEKSSSKVAEVIKEAVKNLSNDSMTKITHNDKTVGVYKDKNGEIHYYDLACTHMGCSLGMNDGDKTWDCPCHGSRFDRFGKVIYGPAVDNLKSLDIS